MKIQNLNPDYLSGMIDAFIANYDYHVKTIPAEKCLSYKFGRNNSKSVKIIFSWIAESRQICVDSETNSYEDRGEPIEDYFTILESERIVKLQQYVEETLDKLTCH